MTAGTRRRRRRPPPAARRHRRPPSTSSSGSTRRPGSWWATSPAGRSGTPCRTRALLAALDAAYHHGEPGAVPLPAPDLVVGCVPVADGVLLLLAPADAPPDLRRRTAALHRLAAELAVAANPHAIAFLVSTTAARLLEADACGVYSRTDAGDPDRPALQRVARGDRRAVHPPGAQARAPAVGRGARRHAGVAGGRRAVAEPLPGDGPGRDVERVPGDRLPAPARAGPGSGRRRVQLPDPARRSARTSASTCWRPPPCAPRRSTASGSWPPSRPRAPPPSASSTG